MRKIAITLLLLVSALSACNPTSAPASSTPVTTNQPEPTRQPQPTASLTATAARTSTATATLAPSPTATIPPSATPTPLGGGSGLVLLRSCPDWPGCTWAEFSLNGLQSQSRPYLQTTLTQPEPSKTRLELVDPLSGETRTILDCPPETYSCYQEILSGSPGDDSLIFTQHTHQAQFDGFGMTGLYRLDTGSLEATLVDEIDGEIFGFLPFEGSSQGLISLMKSEGPSELLIYNPDTLERQTLAERMGQFYRFGAAPGNDRFYYRIADFCATELIDRDGNRIAALKESDGILGWIDAETFLVFTANDNPPVCTRAGIALANRYGLTGDWVTGQPVQWALLSPDGKNVFYTTDCNSNGCTKLVVARLDGSDPTLLLESPERQLGYSLMGKFSPDGSQLLFNYGNQLWIVNSDGSQPRQIMETDLAWRVVDWLEE